MRSDEKGRHWSQAVGYVLCFGGGAAVSAAICGYVVSRKMRAYAELVGKPADLQDIHSKEHGNDAETAEASTAAPSKTQVLVPYMPFNKIASPFYATRPTAIPQSAPNPGFFASQPELSTGVRAATAPLPQARLSSAQESAALPEPEQALDNPFSPSPFASISAQKPGCLPLQEDFKLSALFQPSGGLTALAENTSGRFTGNPLGTALPQRHSSSPGPGAQAGGAAALHTARSPSAPQPRGAPAPKAQLGGPAYEPKQLPPCSPSPASRSTSQLLLTTAGNGWKGEHCLTVLPSLRSSGSLDDMHGILQLLRTRSQDTTEAELPQLGALLGRGSYGKVYKGCWNGAMVAVKIIQHSADIKSKIEAFRETLVSANIHHPNVVSTYKIITCEQHGMLSGQQRGRLGSALGSYSECPAHGMGQESQPALMGKPCTGFETLQETWLLSEFCDKGNIDRALCGGQFRNEACKPEMVPIYRCLLDVAAGMVYLHSMGVLHGDLKGGNVLMKSTSMDNDPRGFKCKIGDFGLSRVLEQGSTHISTHTYGTVSYCAPELLKEGKLTKAADVYSFAMLMWEIYSGSALFRGLSIPQVFLKVMTGYRPALPAGMPEGYSRLMQACWHEEPSERPGFQDIVKDLRCMYLDVRNSGRQSQRPRSSLDLDPWS